MLDRSTHCADTLGTTLAKPPGTEALPPTPLCAADELLILGGISPALADQAIPAPQKAPDNRSDLFTKLWASTALLGCASLGLFALLR